MTVHRIIITRLVLCLSGLEMFYLYGGEDGECGREELGSESVGKTAGKVSVVLTVTDSSCSDHNV